MESANRGHSLIGRRERNQIAIYVSAKQKCVSKDRQMRRKGSRRPPRELSHMSPWQSRIRRCGSAKAARKCGEVGSGYTEPKGWVVGSGRKRSRTIQRSETLDKWPSGSGTRVGLELLRSRTSEAQWGKQWMSFTELQPASQ
ncbi:hypothetical protein EDB86DRAFT_2828953 [Lactarius hatsudake]|nr:hypothetical protein EDB86DRAFT_2831915 [Lactarius hatsudake]KAH8997215.1 hypothetical protein EDB86DRAFT_2828953 [Lactarius hatsudake]